MTRVEELTLKLSEGELTEDEWAELDRAVEQDAEARRVHVSALEIEFALRGERRRVNVSAAVLARVAEARKARVSRGVMDRIHERPRPKWARGEGVRTRRAWAWAVPLALAAGVALAVGWRANRQTAAGTGAGSRDSEVASVIEQTGAVNVRRRTGTQSASGSSAGTGAGSVDLETARARSGGAGLRAGDRIETAAGATATVRYVGATTLRLGPETVVTLAASGGRAGGPAAAGGAVADLLLVSRGTVHADVAAPGEPGVAFETPHARATAVVGSLRLRVTPAGTRLEVASGRARFRALPAGAVAEVAAGQHAEAAALARAPGRTAALPREPVTVIAYDFEDADAMLDSRHGQFVQECPPGAPSRTCALGSVTPWGLTVHVTKRPHMFFYSHRTAVSFDYWVGRETKRLWVQVWNAQRQRNYAIDLHNIVHESWAHAEVRVKEMPPVIPGTPPMEEGEPLRDLSVGGGLLGGKPLYIDNLRVVELPP